MINICSVMSSHIARPRIGLGIAALFVAVFALSGALMAFPDGEKNFEEILPADTLLFMGIDDYGLFQKYAESMPISKILAEEEIDEFLKKPKLFMETQLGMLKKQFGEGNEAMIAEMEKIKDLEASRLFFAITHIDMPDMNDQSAPPMPDIGITLGLKLKGGHDPLEIVKNLIKVGMAQAGQEAAFETGEYNGVQFTRIVLPDAPPFVFPYCFNVGDLFVLTMSEKSMKAIVDCNSGASDKCLKKNENYTKLVSSVTLPAAGSVNAYVDMDGMMNLLKDGCKMLLMAERQMDMVEKVDLIAEKLGLNSLQSTFSRSLSKDGIASAEGIVSYINKGGLLDLFPLIPIDKKELAYIPKKASSFAIARFDMPALYDLIMDTIKVVDENIYNEIHGSIQGMSAMISQGGEPIDLRADIIGKFGTSFIYYQESGANLAMGGMPPMCFLFELNDYDAYVGSLKRVIDGLMKMPDVADNVRFTSTTFSEQEIYYFQFPAAPIPLSPGFTKVGKYLAFGMQIDDLKKVIRRHGGEGESILENEDFTKMYAMIPKELPIVSLSYNRIKDTFSDMYNSIAMVVPMATMALPPDIDLPVDLQLLPTSECITDHLFSSIAAGIKVSDNSFKSLSYGPMGFEFVQYVGPIVTFAGLTGASFGGNMTQARSDSTRVELIPEIEIDEGEMQRKKAIADIAQISAGCFIYKIEYDKFPDSIASLLKPNENWPNGFIEDDSILKDPWGNDYLYKSFSSGDKYYMIWSKGPNGADEGGQGDDVVKIKQRK